MHSSQQEPARDGLSPPKPSLQEGQGERGVRGVSDADWRPPWPLFILTAPHGEHRRGAGTAGGYFSAFQHPPLRGAWSESSLHLGSHGSSLASTRRPGPSWCLLTCLCTVPWEMSPAVFCPTSPRGCWRGELLYFLQEAQEEGAVLGPRCDSARSQGPGELRAGPGEGARACPPHPLPALA